MQAMMCDPHTSGCALVVRGFWRLFGVKDPRVGPPYKPGKVIEWLLGIAKARGAWVDAHPDKLPGVGDAVLVGGNPATDGGGEHVYTVLELRPNPLTIHSLDGGQLDESHNQSIRRKQRTWVARGGALWDVVSGGTDPGATA